VPDSLFILTLFLSQYSSAARDRDTLGGHPSISAIIAKNRHRFMLFWVPLSLTVIIPSVMLTSSYLPVHPVYYFGCSSLPQLLRDRLFADHTSSEEPLRSEVFITVLPDLSDCSISLREALQSKNSLCSWDQNFECRRDHRVHRQRIQRMGRRQFKYS